MLKQRIITALILVAMVLAALFTPNSVFWRGLISLAVLAGFFEWLKFCEIATTISKICSYTLFGVCFYAMQMGHLPMSLVVPVACALWLVLLIFTVSDNFQIIHNRWIKLVVGVLVLSISGWLVIEFKEIENGHLWILCFMVSVWAADVGAYFVGKRFGKTKLARKVSPGKTVEGLLGGLALVLLVFLPVLFTQFSPMTATLLLITVLLTAIISVGGDLFESKLKRYAGLKDSSQILPGHGGMLDRIDSLLAGAPIFSGGLLLLGYLA